MPMTNSLGSPMTPTTPLAPGVQQRLTLKQTAIDTWIPHEVVSEFQNLFPLRHSDEYFYGAGPTEGSDEYFLLFLYIISKIHLLG